MTRSRYRGALLGALVGDVLGAPFEGHHGVVPEDRLAASLADSSVLPFTDDTALTVALAESILRVGGLDEHDLALAFADAWAAAPHLGYSSRTADLLASIHAAGRRSKHEPGNERPSNGAAMRVTPIALWAAGRRTEVAELTRRSARVTHRDDAAIEAAVAQAVAVTVALDAPEGVPPDPARFVQQVRLAVADPVLDAKLALAAELAQRGDAAEIAARLGTSLLARESVPAAICALLSHLASFTDAVTLAIRLGGDADTIASMTAAISGALLGESAIPQRWRDRTTAVARVRALADQLFGFATSTLR